MAGHTGPAPDVEAPRASAPPLRHLAAFRDLHAGATVLVCGCGPSLATVPRGAGCLTIGVNDVGRVLDPDYLVVVNPPGQFCPERRALIEETRARAVFSHLAEWRLRRARLVPFRLGSYNGVDPPAGDALHYTQNSPYVAVCLALHMGAKRVGIIGVDLEAPHPLARYLKQIDAEYGRLALAARARGVEIVNVSAGSRLQSLPRQPLDVFLASARGAPARRALAIVSYATTPVAGVPAVLARCISERTIHRARCVWATDDYGNGVRFDGGLAWRGDPAAAAPALREADLVVVHNGKVHERHRDLLAGKPTITMAHNYAWNVDRTLVDRGHPGVVVGQYQATLPEFCGWTPVANPVPWWDATFSPGQKTGPIRICYTPSGRHERYPAAHPLYWHAKGYDTTLRVLDRLAKRFPIVVETTRERQVSHVESLAMKRRAHIVVDECVTGSYHRNSLEGLAAGAVVVNGVGLVPEIAAALLDCTAPRAAGSPFVCADLERLESVLAGLIALGAPELVDRGAEGRRWLETHWSFADQWDGRWAEVVEHAMHVARTKTAMTPQLRRSAASPEGVTVVIPHGGAERLPLLATTVASVKQHAEVGQIIIAEGGDRPLAGAIAARWGVDHMFVDIRGAFNKSRVLNAGSALARYDVVLWWDNDLLFPGSSLRRAIAEMRDQGCDVFFPFFRIVYLDAADSAAVAQGLRDPAGCRATASLEAIRGAPGGLVMVRADFVEASGGLCEEFRGWGGEDCAWLHTARQLGRVGVTAERQHIAYHQWHRGSGIFGGDPRLRNGAYDKSAALWAEIARLSSPEAVRARLPPPAYRPLPWTADTHVAFVVAENASPEMRAAAQRWTAELAERFDADVSRSGGTGERHVRVVFGDVPDTGQLSFRVTPKMAEERGAGRLVAALSVHLAAPARPVPLPLDVETLPVWMYWEGPCPEWIEACRATLLRHAPNARVLDRAGFEALRDSDRDVDISRLQVAHRADFVRAYLLHRYGGLWLDCDCIALQSLAPVIAQLSAWDFVGHRERAGLVSNAFMAARPGSAIAKAFYEAVVNRLRSPEPLTWISLGNEPLTRVVDTAPVPWLELDVEQVQPICWSRPEAYFVRAAAAAHADTVRPDALCYMLSHQNVVRHQTTHPDQCLTAPDSLFSYLIAQSAGAAPAAGPGLEGSSPFFADAIVRLRPRRVLEMDCRSSAWSELAKECAAGAAEISCASASATLGVPPGVHYDLIIAVALQSPVEPLLARADYVLFASDAAVDDALLSTALVEGVTWRGSARGRAGLLSLHDPAGLRRRSNQVGIFRRMHASHNAEGHATTSGPGSTLEQTEQIRQRLPLLLQHLRARGLLDVACGDFFWQRHTRFGVDRYVGTDILDEVVCANRRQFGTEARVFLTRDARIDPLPRLDVILCRDYLGHLSVADIWRTLANFAASGSRFLVTTTFPGRSTYPDIRNGEWRPLDLCAPPFSLPAPDYLIEEKCTEGSGAFRDKSLGVWRLSDIAARVLPAIEERYVTRRE